MTAAIPEKVIFQHHIFKQKVIHYKNWRLSDAECLSQVLSLWSTVDWILFLQDALHTVHHSLFP